MKVPLIVACGLIAVSPIAAVETPPENPKIAPYLADLQTIMSDMEDLVNDGYSPRSKVDKAFGKRCDETGRQLRGAQSLNEAYVMISDTLWSLDPRIRLRPPQRTVWTDYGWDWRLVGDAAYVCQVDQVGEARKQGLLLGDKIVAVEGLPLNRATYQQVYYLLNTLTQRPGLQVIAQSPGAEPRPLALAATIRPQRGIRQTSSPQGVRLSRTPNAAEEKQREEFVDVKRHVRRFGNVGVWDAVELHRDSSAVAQGWKQLQGIEGLVLDLRGKYVHEYDTVLRLAQNLFAADVEVGRIEKDGLDTALRINGRTDAFTGTLLVLVDSETAVYGELLAHVIRQQKRGVIIGDRTMGRLFQEESQGRLSGRLDRLTVASMLLPTGEIVLSDGTQIDGRGVAPDYLLLPKAADLAAKRDVVLAKALGMLKQTVTPEEAYRIFPHYGDDDDEF